MLRNRTEERKLACILTEEEKRFKTGELVKALGDKEQAEKEKKEVTSGIQARINGYVKDISELTRQISTGVEYRYVECIWYPNYKEAIKKLIRTDTGECLHVDKLADHERQGLIGDEPDSDDTTLEGNKTGHDTTTVAVDELVKEHLVFIGDDCFRCTAPGLECPHGIDNPKCHECKDAELVLEKKESEPAAA